MPRRRVRLIAVFVVLAFVTIGARLTWLQGFQFRDYQIRELSRRTSVRLIPARRGEIVALNGEVLARDIPRHDLVYNLTEIEQTRRVAIRLSRLIRNSGRSVPDILREESIYTSLQDLRSSMQGYLGRDVPLPRHEWLRYLDRDLGEFLHSRISRRPKRYPGLEVELSEEGASIWVHPDQLFAGEGATRRVERRLGLPPGSLYYGSDGQGGIWKRYLDARAVEDPGRRQGRFDRERVLVRGVPFDFVVEYCYWPENFPGLHLREAHQRDYPAGVELAHVVGQAGPILAKQYDKLKAEGRFLDRLRGLDDPRVFRVAVGRDVYLTGDAHGRSGLESRFESHLHGVPGARFVEIDGHGREVGEPLEVIPARDGQDLQLTIDTELCRAIRKILEDRHVIAGSVLVGRPDGELLGWVSHPSYDPRTLGRDFDQLQEQIAEAPLVDRPSRFELPPGSTIKPAVALAALAEEKVTPSTIYVCHGVFDRSRPDRLRCRNHAAGLEMDMERALTYSCNCYFYHVGGRLLDLESFGRRLFELGFGRRTGLPLSDLAGDLPFTEYGLTSASIGQGELTATPVQLYRFTCAVANRGRLPRPRILLDAPPEYEELPQSRAALDQVVSGMKLVVEEGTASKVGLSSYDCAAKTGTADRKVRGQDPHNVAWIIGFTPVEDPQLVFVVEVEQTSLHGGERSGPIVSDILAWLVRERGYTLERGLREEPK